ncbi:GNAT family N-acetyltransferase [Bacillaceae bacterium SIJ1]|uniref:GNAT family N-acetyltransferase n=1 Tax=Litoribacterium kuwaitense TaxID=1398745 RepID=UPI0013EAD14D|nr:GNAT family N-acetyltransferase [Litoribacterium kuwaitense]NGP45912.1 GNAT family N-acetyltransferase [Litoribacterium kuwaitense]
MDVPTLYTNRLRLRPLREQDAQPLFQILSNKEVTKMYGMEKLTTFEEAVLLVRSLRESVQYGWGLRWAIEKTKTADRSL